MSRPSTPPASSVQRRVKTLDDRCREARELVQKFNHRLAVNIQTEFSEHYRQGGMCIALRHVLSPFRGCGLLFRAATTTEAASLDTWDGRNLDEAAMLTHNVELMECPKQTIASVVRFERFDDPRFGDPEPLFTFETRYRIDHVLERSEDGEVCLVTRDVASAQGQCSAKQIERTADRANDRSDLCVDYERQRGFCLYYHDLLPHLRIEVHHDRINAHVLPSNNALPKGWELGFAPLDRSPSI